MSYRRSFTKRIAVHYSGTASTTVSVSVDGKSVSKHVSIPYSGVEYEDVTVNVNVDTDPFDNSIGNCNNQVGILTGAVVATEQAQVVAIEENAMKVGKTIIDGFFNTVRSDISQQIVELKNGIDALLLHLNELAKRCVAKQHQMETDYNRLSTRYLKIFEDLNGELENRIYEIDKPVFVFKRSSDKSSYRALSNDSVGVATVFNAENSKLQATISASVAKKKALDTLKITNSFLNKQKQTEVVLQHCILNIPNSAIYYTPVCYIETHYESERIDKNIYRPGMVTQATDNELIETIKGLEMPAQSKESIKIHFNQELNSRYSSSNSHDERVREYITTLFNKNTILQ